MTVVSNPIRVVVRIGAIVSIRLMVRVSARSDRETFMVACEEFVASSFITLARSVTSVPVVFPVDYVSDGKVVPYV